MNTIISTKPYSCMYSKYETDIVSHSLRVTWSCRIAGGAGVVQGKGHLYTPDGVATEIDDEGLEILLTIPQFQNDVKRNLIKVIRGTKAKLVDIEDEVKKDMNTEPDFRPISEKDLKESGAVIDEDGAIDVSGDPNDKTNSVAKKIVRRRRSK